MVFSVPDAFGLVGKLYEEGVEVGPLDAAARPGRDASGRGPRGSRASARGAGAGASLRARLNRAGLFCAIAGGVAATTYIVLALVLSVGDNDR